MRTPDLKYQSIKALRLARAMLKSREALGPKGNSKCFRNSLCVRFTDDQYSAVMRDSYDHGVSASTWVRNMVGRSLAKFELPEM